MHLAIAGPPDLLANLFETAARSIRDGEDYSFSGMEDEDGLELTIDFEVDPVNEGISWEKY